MNQSLSTVSICPALGDPVFETQQCFRAALRAMSEPGLVFDVPVHPLAPDEMPSGLYALCLSLFDAETPVWLSPTLDHLAIRANLVFHCGCPFVDEREKAAFALLSAAELGDLSGFERGSDRYPDRSCTLLVPLDSLEGGAHMAWRGPGIDGAREVALPVPESFWRQRASGSDFPRGLDAFFVADDRLVGLPRSTRAVFRVEEVA